VEVVASRSGPEPESRPGDFAARSEAAAFAAVYPALRRFASSVAGPSTDPDDLVQEAVARTLQGGPLARLDQPLAYLRRAVLNLARDEHRQRERATRVAYLLESQPAGEDVQYPSDIAFLEVLKPLERALLHLVHLEGLSVREASHVVGCLPATGRARIMRARGRLRASLEAEAES
jgi:RNA polymerase sigma factor (sigma-70 family)